MMVYAIQNIDTHVHTVTMQFIFQFNNILNALLAFVFTHIEYFHVQTELEFQIS
jgi:hypothetical protein